jgi:hypothetical protein
MSVVAESIVDQFDLEGPLEVIPFEQRGNINLDAFLVSDRTGKRYILHRINPDVFRFPERVIQGTANSLKAQREGLNNYQDLDWRVPKLVHSKDDKPFVEADGFWRMQDFLENVLTFKSLSNVSEETRLHVAREAGRGLAIYLDLTASLDPNGLAESLPGYRNTQVYVNQLESALAGCRERSSVGKWLPEDPDILYSTEPHFYMAISEVERLERRHDPELQHYIELALEYAPQALEMMRWRQEGKIRQIAIHGDTKLENFLFCADSQKAVALVDLDTIMPHTWLADWGDMVRSLSNVAGEKERDVSKIDVDIDIYKAVKEGFLSTATTPTQVEINLMERAVQVIAYELGIRFLADYLRGDTYFGVAPNDPEDINKVRAIGQLRLFERLMELEDVLK